MFSGRDWICIIKASANFRAFSAYLNDNYDGADMIITMEEYMPIHKKNTHEGIQKTTLLLLTCISLTLIGCGRVKPTEDTKTRILLSVEIQHPEALPVKDFEFVDEISRGKAPKGGVAFEFTTAGGQVVEGFLSKKTNQMWYR